MDKVPITLELSAVLLRSLRDNMEKYSYNYYYRYIRILLTFAGTWFYQSNISRILFILLSLTCTVTQTYLQAGSLVGARNVDTDVFLECIAPVLINLMCYSKYFNFLYKFKEMKKIYEKMADDWETYDFGEEGVILRQYAQYGKNLIVFYGVCICAAMAPYMVPPAFPFIRGLLNPNGTNQRPLMFRVDCIYDDTKYDYITLLDSYLGCFAHMTYVIGIDGLYIVFVNHACSIFRIIGHRLENLEGYSMSDVVLHPAKENDSSYKVAAECVVIHSKTILYAEHIKDANSVSSLMQLALNMTGITFSGFQAAMLIREKPQEAFRYTALTLMLLSHLYCKSWPGQQLYDHSRSLSEHAYNGNWFLTSARTRKLLNMIVMRCNATPCVLSAGKIYHMNIANFTSVVKTSMSYFTVLSSVR